MVEKSSKPPAAKDTALQRQQSNAIVGSMSSAIVWNEWYDGSPRSGSLISKFPSLKIEHPPFSF